MKARQILPIALGMILLGGTVWGEVPPAPPIIEGTPLVGTETASQGDIKTNESTEEAPWKSIVITQEDERNNKLKYYKKKGYYPKTIGNGKLITYFSPELPRGVVEEIQYSNYPVSRDYLINLLGSVVTVKSQPRFASSNVLRLGRFQHIATDGIVVGEYSEKGNTDQWYRVKWGDPAAPMEGYVFAPWISKRDFQFEKMARSIERLKEAITDKTVAHIDNYKNHNGYAPKHNGNLADDFGVVRDQGAAAYFYASTASDFRYLTDGSMVTVLGESNGLYQIGSIDFDGVYYVDKKYVRLDKPFTSLEKVVVVDRNNQNEAVFQRGGNQWKLISYLFATTGENAKFKQETSLGNFMVMEKKSKFLYMGDISKEIEGYAPYALRFNGGAYIHGVPVGYRDIKQKKVVKPAVLDAMGNVVTPAVVQEVVVGRNDPGIQEYLSTIGTTARSHKCVRNYSSHAKFLYEWAEVGKTAVIVIE